MQEKQWQQMVASMILLGAFTFPVFAQEGVLPAADAPAATAGRSMTHRSGVRGQGHFVDALNQSVGLTPEQADAVRGLLAEQRAEVLALRQKTDEKIRQLLNAEQQKKFDAFLVQQKQAARARFHRES